MTPARRRKCLRIALALFPLAAFLFWFVTAPCAQPVQRWVAGGPDWLSDPLIRALDEYEAPQFYFYRFPELKRLCIRLGNFWWEVLDPPDTTP
jgi:hypothetical protein